MDIPKNGYPQNKLSLHRCSRGRQFLECYEAERDYSDDMKHHCLTAQWHGFLSY